MKLGSLILVCIVVLGTASISSATPAPEPKPPEARLEVKPVAGKTELEQAKIRQEVLKRFAFALNLFVLEPRRPPGFRGDYSVPERLAWMEKYLKVAYVGNTGVLRITCTAGTPHEAAAYVNDAAWTCLASHEEHKKDYRRSLGSAESWIQGLNPASKKPNEIGARNDAIMKSQELRQLLAETPEITWVQMAPIPRVGKGR